jgi:hypothetical protein
MKMVRQMICSKVPQRTPTQIHRIRDVDDAESEIVAENRLMIRAKPQSLM